jgi:hypothetical protein
MSTGMSKVQFRVLYRQFLFRMVDLELLSPAAQGDINGLLGRFAALLLFVSLWLGFLVLVLGSAKLPPPLRYIAVLAMEHFLIATTMLVVGLFAVVSWDSMFPDRRDVLILSPLPIQARTLFLAKAAAIAAALGLTVGIVNVFSSLASPVGFVSTGGVLAMLRMFGAYWITMLAAGAFNFCLVLSLQGLAQLLPRQKFLRLSAILQIAAFCLFLSMYFLQLPFASPAEMLSSQNMQMLPWLPSYWFLALFQQLNGDSAPEALAELARRAWIGSATVFGGAVAAYLICYFRTLRKIAEQPDILPSSTGLRPWLQAGLQSGLPRFGGAVETAVAQFGIRTLFRSRRHRVTLAFYLGIAMAIVLFFSRGPEGPGRISDARRWHQANVPMLMGSILAMCSAVVGMRMAFTMPIDLRANWVFRIMPIGGGEAHRAGVRRTLLALAVVPTWLASAAVFLWMWPWRQAAGHLAVLGLIGIILVELCLQSFRKIPFTCSYLPGKSQFHVAAIVYVVLTLLLEWGTERERVALVGDHKSLAIILVSLAIAAGLLRWLTVWQADSPEEGLEFEDIPAPAVMVLGLNRDGTSRV